MSYPVRLSIRYFGEFFIHPGIILGIEYKIVGNDENEFLGVMNIGFYYHMNNHLSLFLYPELGYRHSFLSGFNIQGFTGLGYLHYFPGAKVFTVKNSIVSRYKHPGYHSLMPSIRFGIGSELISFTDSVHGYDMCLQLFGIYPFNSYFYKSISCQIGSRYQLY